MIQIINEGYLVNTGNPMYNSSVDVQVKEYTTRIGNLSVVAYLKYNSLADYDDSEPIVDIGIEIDNINNNKKVAYYSKSYNDYSKAERILETLIGKIMITAKTRDMDFIDVCEGIIATLKGSNLVKLSVKSIEDWIY